MVILMLFKRLFKYYLFELFLAVVFIFLTIHLISLSTAPEDLYAYLSRKIMLWSLGLVFYYVARYIKIGQIEYQTN